MTDHFGESCVKRGVTCCPKLLAANIKVAIRDGRDDLAEMVQADKEGGTAFYRVCYSPDGGLADLRQVGGDALERMLYALCNSMTGTAITIYTQKMMSGKRYAKKRLSRGQPVARILK
jgi:hypothetical protein